jgi:hypothetical protein
MDPHAIRVHVELHRKLGGGGLAPQLDQELEEARPRWLRQSIVSRDL